MTHTCFLFLFLLSISMYGHDPLTFFIAADPHVGRNMAENNEENIKKTIDDMNALPGTCFPSSKELVPEPKGLLIAGDLTGNGRLDWSGYWFCTWKDGFEQLFHVNGRGRCRFPVYEGYGNHDFERDNTSALTAIQLRNKVRSTPINLSANGLHYSWDWNGIHFINLNLYPGQTKYCFNSLDFLQFDLQNNLSHPEQPIVIYQHYPYVICKEHWWTKEEKQTGINAMQGYNVIAVFSGHLHIALKYKKGGINMYGIPRTHEQQYFVCHINNDTLTIFRRKEGAWSGKWTKKISRPS